MKKFKIMLVYESGERYIFPFEIIQEVLNLSADQIRQLEEKVLVEMQK